MFTVVQTTRAPTTRTTSSRLPGLATCRAGGCRATTRTSADPSMTSVSTAVTPARQSVSRYNVHEMSTTVSVLTCVF